MKTLEQYPKEIVIITLEEYMNTPLNVLKQMYRDGWEVTEINKKDKIVTIIR